MVSNDILRRNFGKSSLVRQVFNLSLTELLFVVFEYLYSGDENLRGRSLDKMSGMQNFTKSYVLINLPIISVQHQRLQSYFVLKDMHYQSII